MLMDFNWILIGCLMDLNEFYWDLFINIMDLLGNLYEQSSKLPNTKICIRWTLVFIKCKKLCLAMGPFQIAIPHVELHEC